MTFLVGISLLLPYFFFWGMVLRSSLKINPTHPFTENLPKITLICSIRNEEKLLPSFLQNLISLEQSHPHSLNYILVNDQSTDNTNIILNEFLQNVPFSDRISLINTSNGISGKKQALILAFEHTKTEWAYVTDADCITSWQAIISLFQAKQIQTKAVFGPVIYTSKNSFLQVYQMLENSALMFLGRFQSARNNKTMGNAANMLVHVESFKKTNPFHSNLHVAGGDDIFLIEAFTLSGLQIATVSKPSAAVYTPVLETWRELWNQRIRWAKKSQFQSLSNTRNSQILLLLFFILMWTVSTVFLNFAHYEELAMFWGAKIIFDVILLGKINHFYHQKSSTLHKMGASIFQTMFIPLIALAQFFSKVHWKNRSY